MVKWQLTDQAYLDQNFINIFQIASFFKFKIVLLFYIIL